MKYKGKGEHSVNQLEEMVETMKEITTEQAVTKLVSELSNDPDYRMAWLANIAMAFKDQSIWDKRTWNFEETHETANKAADYFLRLLCNDFKYEKDQNKTQELALD